MAVVLGFTHGILDEAWEDNQQPNTSYEEDDTKDGPSAQLKPLGSLTHPVKKIWCSISLRFLVSIQATPNITDMI